MTEILTNEGLKGICLNNFELAHYAIELARYYIHSSHEVSLSGIIKEIKKHPSPKYVKDLKEIDRIEAENERDENFYEEG